MHKKEYKWRKVAKTEEKRPKKTVKNVEKDGDKFGKTKKRGEKWRKPDKNDEKRRKNGENFRK